MKLSVISNELSVFNRYFLLIIVLTGNFSGAIAQTQTPDYRSVGGFITGVSEVQPSVSETDSGLSFKFSDTRMVDGFNRAKIVVGSGGKIVVEVPK